MQVSVHKDFHVLVAALCLLTALSNKNPLRWVFYWLTINCAVNTI